MSCENSKLSKFTDFFNDDFPNSQPISLPSTSDSLQELENNLVQVETERIRPRKGYGQNGEFRCADEVDSKYRAVFTYPYFNLVQSKLIDDALYSAKSMVVSAPTGSGKTVVFEMAIVQLLAEMEEKNCTDDYKIIYMAPVKALCSERLAEWYGKFARLGLLCIEVTGDTDVDFPQLKPYRIIITTPEKWDMLTRRWKDHRGLVEVIKLFLIDEVHILNDEVRGPVLEAVVSRMKTVESSAQSSHRIEQIQRQQEGLLTLDSSPPRIRFVAVSATVSNPDDVATWLGTRERPAVVYKFGDECRPVRLRRVVEGYPCPAGASIFKFDIILNYKIWPIIQRFHNGKPTLIFCNTRKSVLLTAETLSKELTVSFSQEQKAQLMEIAATIKTKKIQALILAGVGCHHAGLLYEERQTIEDAFRDRKLPILITTTTLAMGVNLPAHLVIIKNTQQYVNGTYQEYSISTVLQMVGRAGRPQYDTEATAVIMTRLTDKARYEALVGGCEPLQSYLHKRIAENLNSEAALSTVCDVAQCVQWLNSTFFSVRAARDPRRYLGLPSTAPAHQISRKVEELCVKAMNGLASAGLITMDEASCIESTEAGRLMSVYYLDLETMKLIMKIQGTESLEQLLCLVCDSHELSEMHLRVDERRTLNLLNRNKAGPTIRFPMKGKISTRQMKSNCVIQAILGCLPIPDPALNQEATKIIRIAERVCKCLVAYLTRPEVQRARTLTAVVSALMLHKCVCARLWERSAYASRQLRGIGPALSGLLASAGKVNFTLLEESHPRDLERIMNKPPPAGNMLRKQVGLLPKYTFKLIPLDPRTVRVQLVLLNAAHLAENLDNLTAGANHKCYIVAGDSDNFILYFSTFKDSDLVSVYDGCITFEITRLHNHEHKIMVHCISSNFVGLDERCEHTFASMLPDVTNFEINQCNSRDVDKGGIITKNNKRKVNNDVSECNEKRKRGTNFVESLQALKKSFLKSSNDIKTELVKTKDLSNSVLQDILEPDRDACDDTELSLMIYNPENEIVLTNPSYDIDDDEICNILNDIESEISGYSENTKENKIQKKTLDKQMYNTKEIHTAVVPKNTRTTFKCKGKILNTKNNFSFIDRLEKQAEEESKKSPGGLSTVVKEQILNFLDKAKDKSIEKDTPVNILVSDDYELEESNVLKQSLNSNCPVTPEVNDEFTKVNESGNILNSTPKGVEIDIKIVKKLDSSDQPNLRINELNRNNFTITPETPEQINKDIDDNRCDQSIQSQNDTTNNTTLVPYIDQSTTTNEVLINEENATKIANTHSNKLNNIELPKNVTDFENLISTYKNNNTMAIVKKSSVEKLSLQPQNTVSLLQKECKENCVRFLNSTNILMPRNKEQDAAENYNTQPNITYPDKLGTQCNETFDNEIRNCKMYTKKEEYVNNFRYSASKINVIKRNDSQVRIVNKVEIDLKVTQIVCTETNSEKLRKDKENTSAELRSINNTVNCNLTSNRNISDISNYTPSNNESESKEEEKYKRVSFDPPDLHNADNNFSKDEKCSFKNIIEKYRLITKSEAQQAPSLPKINFKTFTPIVKSQKQYRIKDINKSDDMAIMKNISQIFCEGKRDRKESPTAPSLSDKNTNITQLGHVADTVLHKGTANLTTEFNTAQMYGTSGKKYDLAENETIRDVTDEDNVFDASNYTGEKTSSNSPLTDNEDIKSILAESENEEVQLSMLNPQTLLECIRRSNRSNTTAYGVL